MASRGNDRAARRRRATGAAAAAAVTAAIGLAAGPAGAVEAAASGWVPLDHAMRFLPVASTDGEISVTQLCRRTAPRRCARSRPGTDSRSATRMQPATRDSQWGPGGDVVSARAVTRPAVPDHGGKRREPVRRGPVSGPTQWSPVGDSLAQTDKVSGGYQPVARWLGLQPRGPTPLAAPDRRPGHPRAAAGSRGRPGLGAVRRSRQARPRPRRGRPRGLPGRSPASRRRPSRACSGHPSPWATATSTPTIRPSARTARWLSWAPTRTGRHCSSTRETAPSPSPRWAPSAQASARRSRPAPRAIAFVVSAADCASSELRLLEKSNGTFAGAVDSLVAILGRRGRASRAPPGGRSPRGRPASDSSDLTGSPRGSR